MPEEARVILVNHLDEELGSSEKLAAHIVGDLHRAFSVFVFNTDGEMLIQRRADTKYHSAGLWSNTCCSHPRPGETTIDAAHRRLKEEMNFDCELTEVFSLLYKVKLGELIENEFDHVFVGTSNDDPTPNPSEASDWRRISMDDLRTEISKNPDRFTYWFELAYETAFSRWNKLRNF